MREGSKADQLHFSHRLVTAGINSIFHADPLHPITSFLQNFIPLLFTHIPFSSAFVRAAFP